MMCVDERKPILSHNEEAYMMLFGEHEQIKVTFIEVVGKGGTCIAYRGIRQEGDIRRQCIIKEYYPEFTTPGIRYERDENGVLHILSSDRNESEEKVQSEKQNQKKNVERECMINQSLFCSEDENSPYIYSVDCIREFGDSTYVVLDTTKGKTLKTFVSQSERTGIGLEKTLLYTRKLLEIVRWMNREKGYIHGDITPQNIWLTGENENVSLKLLDLGSAFEKKRYELDETADDTAILECAKEILYNEGIGSSTEGFRSTDILGLWEAKQRFSDHFESLKRARELLEQVKRVSLEQTDIYAAIKVFYYMLTGVEYNGSHGPNDIMRYLGEAGNELLAHKILILMKNNGKMHYDSIEKIMKELDSFEDILKGNCTPDVLLQALSKEIYNQAQSWDERLFAPIKILE